MGAGPILVRDLSDPDQGHPHDGRRLSLSRGRGLPLAWRSLPKDFGPWQTVRGYWDRFRRDGVRADVAALLIPAARARRGKAPAPSTGIVDARSVASGPRRGERGVDGDEKVKG